MDNKDIEKIIEEGVGKLRRDLFTYPHESIKKKSKRLVMNMLGRNESAPDSFFWPHAMMARALWVCYETSSDESILKLLQSYYDSHQLKVSDIKYPDTVMNGYTLIDIHEKTGNPKYKQTLDAMAEYIKNTPAAPDGSISYRTNQKEVVYADTIGMVVPFMCRYGAMTGDAKLQELALKQVENFIKRGMDNETGLPYHAYNADDGVKRGIIGWGRAVGWIFMGIADSFGYVSDDCKEQLHEVANQLLPSIIKYQRNEGLFSWQLQAVDGPIDISATGMILLSLKKMMKQNLIDEKYMIIERGKDTIISLDGAYNKCLAECEALSCYPQIYGEYPWGTAAVTLFLQECRK